MISSFIGLLFRVLLGELLRFTVTIFPADRNQFVVHMSNMQILPRAGVSAVTFSAPAAAWLVLSLFGVIVSVAEVTVALAVVLTALYGNDRHSGRAFRLLRLSFSRPGPAGAPRRVRGKGAGLGPRSRRGRS